MGGDFGDGSIAEQLPLDRLVGYLRALSHHVVEFDSRFGEGSPDVGREWTSRDEKVARGTPRDKHLVHGRHDSVSADTHGGQLS
jgi:hypothetical protein